MIVIILMIMKVMMMILAADDDEDLPMPLSVALRLPQQEVSFVSSTSEA